MAQIIEKVIESKSQKIEQSESYEVLGDLNPRYFEEGYSLEEAKDKARASRINISSNNSFFGGF
ncbi:MAG: hypothetical protein ACFFG0_41755 [Candidatus Thorarchaeota archaeon]